MTEALQVYKCLVCGIVAEVLDDGAGELVCCGQPMEQMEAKTADAPAVPPEQPADTGLGGLLGEVLGLNVPRNQRLSNTQKAAREVTRDLSESLGGAIAGSAGKQIFRSILGGILRR